MANIRSTRSSRLAGVLLALACGGCMVGPDFKSPSAPVAEQWLEANDPTVRTRHQQYQ